MVIYYVRWLRDDVNARGTTKGRPCKKSTSLYGFTVLCRNASDATRCLQHVFYNVWHLDSVGLCLEDGEISMKRVNVDSRNFEVTWLFMDGIREPISLLDLDKSLFRLSNQSYL